MLKDVGACRTSGCRSRPWSPRLTRGARAVKKFADEVVAPKVIEMDENEKMDPQIIKGLFEQGVRAPVRSLSTVGDER